MPHLPAGLSIANKSTGAITAVSARLVRADGVGVATSVVCDAFVDVFAGLSIAAEAGIALAPGAFAGCIGSACATVGSNIGRDDIPASGQSPKGESDNDTEHLCNLLHALIIAQ